MHTTLSGPQPAEALILADLRRENARLRGDLLTVARRVSHDLRTPLGGVISSGEALQEILAAADPGAVPLVISALGSAEEISQLVKRVSFVLKATAVPCPLERAPMGESVLAALNRLQSQIIKKGAIISQPDEWPEVAGVGAWLEVVWWNFLANALQHAGPAPRIALGWEKEGGKHRFWVSDHGPGVAEGRRAKLFQPFDLLHEPDAAQGLGLSVVQRLMELQGGDCGYRANPGGGAGFFFELASRF